MTESKALAPTLASGSARPASRARPGNPNVRIPGLDGMRGLAILLVMFYHMTLLDPAGAGWMERTLANASGLGATGVDLFFVLSGFLITGILFDTKQHHHYFRNFYIRRVLRIFPLYYAVLAFALVIMPALVAHVPQAHHKASRLLVSGSDWLWYASYTSNFLIAKAGAFRNGMLDVSWSLAIEEQFYVLWPPLVYCLSAKALKRACVGIVFFALVFRTAMWLAGYSWIQVYTVTPCRLDSLAMGGFFAVWLRTASPQSTTVLRRARLWVGVLGGGVLAGYALGWLRADTPLTFTVGYLVLGVFYSQLMLLGVFARAGTWEHRLFSSPVLAFFGKYSYAMYLFHLPIRAAVRDLALGSRQIHALPGGALLWQCAFYAICIILTTAAALLSWYAIEKQALKLKAFFPR